MLPDLSDIGFLALVFLVSSLSILLLMPYYIRFLKGRNRVVVDAHKKNPTFVPSPAGPLLVLGLVLGELTALLFYHGVLSLVLVSVVAVAGAIGLVDDLFMLGGIVKPALMVLSAVPIVLAGLIANGVFSPSVSLPIFGSSSPHFTIYIVLILASLPIVSNAYNMMDAFNGEIAGFTLLTSVAVLVALALKSYALSDYSVEHLAVALPLVAVSAAFYLFNRFPSRIFDGDSGSLPFGAMYASLAIVGGVEVAAVVAIIPAILNSFYILTSVRGFIEHSRMHARPTFMGEDGQLYASTDKNAPATIARMVLLRGPLSEKDVVRRILYLTAFACLLSVLTSVLTWLIL